MVFSPDTPMSAAPAMTSPVLLTLPYRSFTMVEPCKWSVQMVAFHHSNVCTGT